MKERLYVIGFLLVRANCEPRWVFHHFTGSENGLVDELKKGNFWIIQYDLNQSKDNAFICEYDEEKGKVLRDDLFIKVFPDLKPVPDPSLVEMIDLDLSVRMLNVFKEMGIRLLSEIIDLCVTDGIAFAKIKWPKFGKKSNEELRQMLMLRRALISNWQSRDAFI
jgi:hypothetical protein